MAILKRCSRLVVEDAGDGIDFSDEKSLTKQAHAAECDINMIVLRCQQTGMVPVSQGSPMYGDFTSGEDFAVVMRRIVAAQQQFDLLPANVRDRFDNNVSNLLDFLADPANKAEARKLNLIPPAVRVDGVTGEGGVKGFTVDGVFTPYPVNTPAAAPAAGGAPAGDDSVGTGVVPGAEGAR